MGDILIRQLYKAADIRQLCVNFIHSNPSEHRNLLRQVSFRQLLQQPVLAATSACVIEVEAASNHDPVGQRSRLVKPTAMWATMQGLQDSIQHVAELQHAMHVMCGAAQVAAEVLHELEVPYTTELDE